MNPFVYFCIVYCDRFYHQDDVKQQEQDAFVNN